MLKCFIVDDNPSSIRLLTQYIDQSDGLENAGSSQSGQQALQILQNPASNIDLVFLDIDIADLSGLDILERIGSSHVVILVSGHYLYAQEAFSKGASGYLYKPVQYDRFLAAIEKGKEIAKSRRHTMTNPVHIYVPGNGREVRVRITTSDICYIQSSTNFCTIFLDDSNVFCSLSLKQMCTVLQPPYFVRINRSILVNSNKIIKYDAYDVYLEGNKVIPFGEKYKSDFISSIRTTGLGF
ncbi:MAG: LytTR family DNA-binding domain-containing protein [Pedobacter sp.]|uniref:LytR/AlgR family response regulator transcription factor n=1 Tax=Pedobacter sp. TaxID=1411316 RepID=UPI003562FD2A